MKVFGMIPLVAMIAIAAPHQAQSRTLSQRLNDLPPSEYVFQGLNLADGATTMYNLHRGFEERNPILGKHPSDAKLIGQIAAIGVVHAAITSVLQDELPEAVKPWEIGGIIVKGGAVAWNVHFHIHF